MKYTSILGLAVAGTLIFPVINQPSLLTSDWNTEPAIAKTVQQLRVKLALSGEKRVVNTDAQGREVITWQGGAQLLAQPGDVIRYRLNGKNESDRPVKNLVLTQPIPQGTVYVLDSAVGETMRVTYSIDGGHSFVSTPTIQVPLPNGKVETRPAKAESYTHVRWSAEKSLDSKSVVQVAYQVKVR